VQSGAFCAATHVNPHTDQGHGPMRTHFLPMAPPMLYCKSFSCQTKWMLQACTHLHSTHGCPQNHSTFTHSVLHCSKRMRTVNQGACCTHGFGRAIQGGFHTLPWPRVRGCCTCACCATAGAGPAAGQYHCWYYVLRPAPTQQQSTQSQKTVAARQHKLLTAACAPSCCPSTCGHRCMCMLVLHVLTTTH
jgi:hypothetical protein